MNPEARMSPMSLFKVTQDQRRDHYEAHLPQCSRYNHFEVQPIYQGHANFEVEDHSWNMYVKDVVALADPELALPIPNSATAMEEVDKRIPLTGLALHKAWEERKNYPGARDERIITEGFEYRQWYDSKLRRDFGAAESRSRRRSSRLSRSKHRGRVGHTSAGYSRTQYGSVDAENQPSRNGDSHRRSSAHKRKMDDREASPGPSAQDRRPAPPLPPAMSRPGQQQQQQQYDADKALPEDETPPYTSVFSGCRPSPTPPEEGQPVYRDQVNAPQPPPALVDFESIIELSYGLPIADWAARAGEEIGMFEPSLDGSDPEAVEYNPVGVDYTGAPMESINEAAHDKAASGRAMGQGVRQRRKKRESLEWEHRLIQFDED